MMERKRFSLGMLLLFLALLALGSGILLQATLKPAFVQQPTTASLCAGANFVFLGASHDAQTSQLSVVFQNTGSVNLNLQLFYTLRDGMVQRAPGVFTVPAGVVKNFVIGNVPDTREVTAQDARCPVNDLFVLP